MMATTTRPCFSNGSEAEWWMDRNCDHCIKAWRLKSNGIDYTKSRCKIQDEILTQWMGYGDEPINQRTYDVTQKADCPNKMEHYQKRKPKKYKNQLELGL